YKEDFNADVDINIVMNSSFEIVEIQGTGEDSTFTIEELNSIFEITRKGISKLIEIQNNYTP
ncbi:MAG: ribonuclease PH, partial [Spirochaetota bacterium]